LSRGRQVKTLAKEAQALSNAITKGDTQAHSKKSLAESLREHIGKMVDRIDPLEALTVGALAVVLQPTMARLPAVVVTAGEATSATFINWALFPFSLFAPSIPNIKPEDLKPNDLLGWLLAFIVAFMIVRHGAEILSAAGGLVKFASGLLPALTA
jgi:hypothetical protein